jgi:hypothetical protein
VNDPQPLDNTTEQVRQVSNELIDKLALRTARNYLKFTGRRPLSTRQCPCGKTISFNKTKCMVCTQENNEQETSSTTTA